MTMDFDLVQLITRAVFTLLGFGLLVLLKHIKAALDAKVEAGKAGELDLLIADFVAAAEQLLKQDDPDGSKRKQYVTDCLMAIGIAITDEINARIEAAVFRQNLEIRAVQ